MKNKLFVLLSTISLFTFSSCSYGIDNSISEVKTSANISSSIEQPSEREIVYINKQDSTSLEPTSIEQAVSKVYDSVVTINAYLAQGYSSGAGVLFGYSETGSYLLTCHHVIESATSFEVTLSSGNIYSATLIGGDPVTDLAVLKINETNLTYATFIANSDDIALGSTTIAIGNPLGILANNVTSGIVSAKSRNIEMEDGTVQNLIQTDAAINSGNSGGGLFDLQGNLIGIVSAKYSATGVEGLGFAIPSNTASYIANELISHGYVTGRYVLGITISDGVYSAGFYSRYNVTYISEVATSGCCYNYLNKNDILVSIEIKYQDGKDNAKLESVDSADEANKFLKDASLSIGDTIIFGIKRNGYNSSKQNIEVPVTQYIYQG